MIGGTGVLSASVSNEALRQGINVVMINRGHRKKTYSGYCRIDKV